MAAARVAVGATLGILGWSLRGRLPTGVGEGLALAGLTGAALMLAAGVQAPGWHIPVGHVLTGLAVLFAIGGLIPVGNATGEARRAVLSMGGLALGAAACVFAMLTVDLTALPDWRPGTLDLAVLLLASLMLWMWSFMPGGAYASIAALLVLLLTGFQGGLSARVADRDPSVIANAIGFAALMVVLYLVFNHRQSRRHAWLHEPERLLDSLVVPQWAAVVVQTCIVLTVLLTTLAFGAWGLPTALAMCGLACLGLSHLRNCSKCGEEGLALAALALGSMPACWFGWSGWWAGICGAALGGAWMTWLARFWEQQLDEGQPWTTTGRQIPAALRLSVAAALTGAGCSLGWLTQGAASITVSSGALTALVVLQLVFALMLARYGMQRRFAPAAFAVALLFATAAAPVRILVERWTGADMDPLVILAALLSLLALRVGIDAGRKLAGPGYNAVLAGVMPVVGLLLVFDRPLDPANLVSIVLIAAMMWVGVINPPRAAVAT